MAKLLFLANLELAFELPDGAARPEELARAKERRLLRLLERLVAEDPEVTGSLESLEVEAFAYDSPLAGESSGYYYNKHDDRAERS